VVESAELPTGPISPNRPVWFTAGTVLGMMLGLALLVLREVSDKSFHSVMDVQNSLGLPVLAAVPELGSESQAGWLSWLPRLRASRV
jgi:capsular polysaccharide biosynthesis protein